ncbi:MAG TPA: tRNA (adenosine(37)-N6)-threonylcarbamoyltransferase complex dimerization subunit type 1 TsaB [Caulobacter sp.]|nr:tRNA (adenosine(37)-N6)-threonylcarbamoyltransferase complex dimerization subunit type 1 TsaB [Caulobacter sp.]
MLLAVDTCLDACSAALLDGEAVLAAVSEPMSRGHQERLAPMVAELMAGRSFGDLDRVAATVGPGSFTGLRVGLAFAKGLSSALSIPLVGIGSLPALAAGRKGFVCAAVDARRGQIYLQAFRDGAALMAPDALAVETAAARLAELAGDGPATLVGSGAPLLAPLLPRAVVETPGGPDPVAVARLAMAVRDSVPPARPLYLRTPDAKLPGGIDPYA